MPLSCRRMSDENYSPPFDLYGLYGGVAANVPHVSACVFRSWSTYQSISRTTSPCQCDPDAVGGHAGSTADHR